MATPTEAPPRLGGLRLLLVEDSENDAFLIERQIRRGGYDVEVTRVTTADEMVGQLARADWDVVISDFHLPGSSLEETLAAFRADGRDIPLPPCFENHRRRSRRQGDKDGRQRLTAEGR